MRPKLIQAVIGFAAIGLIAIYPTQSLATKEDPKHTFIVKPFLTIERITPKVTISIGDSEITKREKEAKATLAKKVTDRENVDSISEAVQENLNLGELRQLYAEVSSRNNIDWKLLEAVHQVETGKSTGTCKRSYAGATGPMQFLPSTFRHYSDGNICNLRDSLEAAAKLLASSGADSGDIDSALLSYNHSTSYVNLVKSVMNSI